MTDPERRQRVEDLCDAALDHDVHERPAFLAAACGDDHALRHDVEALLAHAAQAEGFLTTPIAGVAAQILSAEHEASLVGRQIGSHTILSLLGAGGMGKVYRAHDAKLGRDVAIKVVADTLQSLPERHARFELEARVLATLNHPHIAAIYGLEEADGVRGLVLELVEGTTLAERLARGPLSVPNALATARQIADALEAAHDKGIVHRDLKPANIKITADGTVKVLDFGLAKVFAPDVPGRDQSHTPSHATSEADAGAILGTTAYMSPEQARGAEVDKRTDIWAFGCVLYEMLTARAAFAGDTSAETIAAIRERDPDWDALPPQTPLGVRRLLQRCLQRDARHRLRDIGDARLELDEALGALPASAGSASAHADRQRVAAGRPAPFAWWAGTCAVLLVVAGVVFWQLQRREYFWVNPLDGAKVTRLTDFEGAELHAAISRDGKFVAFLSDRNGPWDVWVSQLGTGDVYNLTKGGVRELRNPGTRTVGFSPDGSFVTVWSRVPDSSGAGLVDAGWTVPTMGGPMRPYLTGISELDWSPDGRRIVYHPPAEGDPIFVTQPDEKVGRQIHVARPGFHNHFPIWSHDDRIYFVHGLPLDKSDIWRISPIGGTPERLTFHDARVTFPTLLNDRTLLYLATDEDGFGPWIYAIDVERRVPHRISTGVESYTSLAASADGRRLVATVSRSIAHLWRVPLGDRVMVESDAAPITLPTASGVSPRVSADNVIYRASRAGTEGLWKLAPGGAATELWNGRNGRAVAGAAVSPDGQRLAFVVQAQGQAHLYVMNADGTGTRRVAEALDVRGAPAWSPDGRWLAVAANQDGEPRLFTIAVDGSAVVPLVRHYSTDPTWSPSGRFLVYSGADVGTTFSVKAVNADGVPRPVPSLVLSRGARRLAFAGEDTLVILKGDISHKDFWSVDLTTGRERQLTALGDTAVIGDFDISSGGREITFDRTREESDIVLFELLER